MTERGPYGVSCAGRDWTVAGTGDLNGDATCDIVWQNAGSGVVSEWIMRNGGYAASANLLTNSAWVAVRV